MLSGYPHQSSRLDNKYSSKLNSLGLHDRPRSFPIKTLGPLKLSLKSDRTPSPYASLNPCAPFTPFSMCHNSNQPRPTPFLIVFNLRLPRLKSTENRSTKSKKFWTPRSTINVVPANCYTWSDGPVIKVLMKKLLGCWLLNLDMHRSWLQTSIALTQTSPDRLIINARTPTTLRFLCNTSFASHSKSSYIQNKIQKTRK